MEVTRRIFLLVFVLFSVRATGQQKTLEEILAMPDDTAKVSAIVDLFPTLLNKNPAFADSIMDVGIRIASSIRDSTGLARCYHNKGWYLQRVKKYEQSIPWFEKSIAIHQRIGNISKIHRSNLMLGIAYYRLNEYEKSDSILSGTVKYAEQVGDLKLQCSALHNLSSSYKSRAMNNEALTYALEAASIREKTNERDLLATDYNSIGLILKDQKRYKEEISYYQKALVIAIEAGNKLNLAIIYNNLGVAYKNLEDYANAIKAIRKSIAYCEPTVSGDIAMSYANLGTVYRRTGIRDSAFYYMRKAMAIDKASNNTRSIAISHYNLAEWYFEDSIYAKSKLHLDTSESLATKAEYRQLLVSVHELKAKLHEKENNLKEAYSDLRKSITIKDSISNVENTQHLQELLTRYEAEKKDREIAEGKLRLKANELEITRKTNANRFLVAGLVALVLVLAIGVVAFRQRQKLLGERKEAEKHKALEQTRAAIARDLHDDIGATLSSIQIMSSFATRSIDQASPDAKQWVQKIADNTGDILQNIRDIVWAMNPVQDNSEELVSRMKHFASQTLEPKGVRYSFEVEEGALEYLDTLAAKRNVFLIFKEAVNNTVKYSGASAVDVTMKMIAENGHSKCTFTVRDNGNGFDMQAARSGNGMRNMKSRATQMGGHMDIDSTTQGTSVKLEC